jgi:hypothetical protein
MKSFALFHNPKRHVQTVSEDAVTCFFVIDGKLVLDGETYDEVKKENLWKKHKVHLKALFMDGCSMDLNFAGFSGYFYVAASPSVSTRNLLGSLGDNFNRVLTLYMPPWSLDEAIAAGGFLDVEEGVVEANYAHMNGIARHLFAQDRAKQNVEEAVEVLSPQALDGLVASGANDNVLLHSLLLWKPAKEDGNYNYETNARFELVSRFAEKKAAEKLAKYDLALLLRFRWCLRAGCGAEAYSGALIEAYAIKKIWEGGTFKIPCLETGKGQETMELKIAPMGGAPVVAECNALTPSAVPLDSVGERADDDKSWKPKLLWPLTSNVPTFDCFYFHTDGEVFPLQMAVSREDP